MRNLFLCLPVDSLDPAVLRCGYGSVVWDAGSETDCALFHPDQPDKENVWTASFEKD